jgi:nitrite reductase/ring-hydroxylating ferredoxin subunit
MNQLSRRNFVAAAGTVACSCLFSPTTLLRAADANQAPVNVGTLKDFARDGVTDTWARSHGFFLIRQQGKLYATSSLCTHHNSAHLSGKVSTEGELVCNQHGSRFSLQGLVTHGPARRSLARYGISANDQGLIAVDTSRRFDQDTWDQPASFVSIP